MILGIDYRFREDIVGFDTQPIEILTGKYKGVVFRYLEVQLLENEENDEVTMRFLTEIIDNKGGIDKDIQADEHYQGYVGNILNMMLLTLAETNIEPGKNDTDEFVEERELHSESTTVPEE